MSSCNENRLDARCTCSSKFGNGALSKIYDIQSGEFVCCGNIKYDMYDALQQEGILVKAAASLDDPRCKTWWTNTINKRDTIAIIGAGPTTAKINTLQKQVDISDFFPNPNINGVSGAVSCVGITSPAVPTVSTTVPRYVSYPNPNAGELYIETLQCVPLGNPANPYQDLKQTTFAKEGDFAIFGIEGCSNLLPPSPNVCVPVNGIENLTIGPLEFESGNYGGSVNPNPKPSNSNTWLIVLLVVLAIIFIVLIIIMFMASGKKVEEPVYTPQPYIENPVYTTPVEIQQTTAINNVLNTELLEI